MLYTTFALVALLTAFLIAQRCTIIKYKNLNQDEMSYVAMLTHDLKSPARAQLNALNLLLKGYFGQLNPKQYEVIKLTCTSSKYMSNLVSSVLSGYKFTSCPIKMNKSEFDIVSLINEIISRYKFMAEDKNLKINFKSGENSYLITGDKLQIERAISNLLSNAITYSFANTNIEIRLNCVDDAVDFSISNMSNPIKECEIKNIFNKFSKTTNSKMNSNSTGLGLYTTKKIIDSHNGKIYAKSYPDGVCIFGFKLNAKEESAKMSLHDSCH